MKLKRKIKKDEFWEAVVDLCLELFLIGLSTIIMGFFAYKALEIGVVKEFG